MQWEVSCQDLKLSIVILKHFFGHDRGSWGIEPRDLHKLNTHSSTEATTPKLKTHFIISSLCTEQYSKKKKLQDMGHYQVIYNVFPCTGTAH